MRAYNMQENSCGGKQIFTETVSAGNLACAVIVHWDVARNTKAAINRNYIHDTFYQFDEENILEKGSVIIGLFFMINIWTNMNIKTTIISYKTFLTNYLQKI